MTFSEHNKTRESKKRIAFPIQLFGESPSTFSELPDEIHVVPTGKWDHPYFGEIEITTADVAEFVSNFKDKVRKDLPITAGHDNGMSGGELPAIGWFRELIDRGVKGLYAVVEWTAEGKRLLEEHAFKYFSAELYHDYEDPQTGERRKNVLVGGALTNKPYFKELDAVIAFSEPIILNQFSNMDIATLLAKNVSDLTTEEKVFLREHQSELDDAQKETLKDVLAESGDEGGNGDGSGDDADKDKDKNKDGNGDGNGAGNGDGGEGAGKEVEQQNASEKNKEKVVTLSEAEATALRDKANKGAQAFAELEKMRIEKISDVLVFSESNKTGRFLPKQKTALCAFMESLNQKQRDQFTNLVNNMPKVQLSFDEKGDSGSTETNVAAEVETAVQAKMKASGLKYADAVKQVFTENPDLAKRYEDSLE